MKNSRTSDDSFTVYSIPHTGTHFLDKLLTDHHVNLWRSIHITGEPEVEEWERLVIPLRHPRQVAKSWAKRFHKNGNQTWKSWSKAWLQLSLLRGHFFIIDGDRDYELKALSDYVGVELTTDWAPQNHMEGDESDVISESQVKAAECIYFRILDVHRKESLSHD